MLSNFSCVTPKNMCAYWANPLISKNPLYLNQLIPVNNMLIRRKRHILILQISFAVERNKDMAVITGNPLSKQKPSILKSINARKQYVYSVEKGLLNILLYRP